MGGCTERSGVPDANDSDNGIAYGIVPISYRCRWLLHPCDLVLDEGDLSGVQFILGV